ncbi:unnamed protein product [Phytomonas sp. EM1]|nr:unnamed protein product [Phytomonas sp. EM1]|eukprot:CCW64063.1 unnamed protein product [Phytomonas sp. isolate EM1]
MGTTTLGSFSAINAAGRHFVWLIPKFSSLKIDSNYNSSYATSFQGVKFHLHITIESPGYVGVYVRFKKRPIPKYSYYFENSKKECMRQHTAHTIDPNIKRCGHWNVCNRADMIEFLGDNDVLMIHYILDDDVIISKQISDKKIVSVTWTIPRMYEQKLNPFSSTGFVVGNTVVVARLDIKRKSSGLIANIIPDDIQSFVIFLFSQGDSVPPHSIELIDSSGKVYAQERMKPSGTPQTLIVKKSVVDENLDLDGALRTRITFYLINPLEVFNFHTPVNMPMAGGNPKTDTARKTGFFGSKGSYTRMEDH